MPPALNSRPARLFVAVVLMSSWLVVGAAGQEPVEYVNTMIGTTGPTENDYGGTVPFVAPPFAMTQWTAMTRENRISVCPYNYADRTVRGFIGTHQPAIWMGDYGEVILMPLTGALRTGAGLPFRHEDEVSTPYYYSVLMGDAGGRIKTELAATTRAAFLKFTFPRSDSSHVVVTAGRSEKVESFVRVDERAREISGYNPDRMSAHLGPPLPNFKGYFVIRFSKPFKSFGTWEGDDTHAGRATRKGHRVGAYVTFSTAEGEQISARVGTSFISVEQARENLSREIPGWDFERVKSEGRREWAATLGKIRVRGGTRDDRVNFYTAMYRAHMFPRTFSEYGRYYSAFDDRVHRGVSYNDYSLWDTFRAEHPLLLLTEPRRVPGMITSLLQMFEEGGWMPMWPNPTYSNIMISTHADSVIADAYVKGVRGFDLQKAYRAVYKDAMTPPDGDVGNRWIDRAPWTAYEARGGLTWYKSLGYVPQDKTDESVSRTLEFAYDDFCVAQLAKAVGKMDDYEMFMKRSRNYRNLYDPAKGFMRPRLASGAWDEGSWNSKEERMPGFTEGGPWTYLFCVMQDVPGFVALAGGPEKFAAKLDENFEGGHYRHVNEPGHHYTYLYDYAGQPWKTQARVREAIAANYRNAPDGLSGNDDCGQMSAWYIFSAMGFYPVTPGSTTYAVGSPLFSRVTLTLGEPYKRGAFTMIARNQSPANRFIQTATLNGRPLTRPFIEHSDIVGGGTLVFVMGPKPNKRWGAAPRRAEK